MPKVKKEVEEQIDEVTASKKKKTFAVEWFEDHTPEDRRDMKIVCDLTSRSADEQFCMSLKSGNTEVYALVFYATFMTILNFLKEKEKHYNQFNMEICNSINIGYTNDVDEDAEKQGNFDLFIEHISINRNIMDDTNVMDAERTCHNLVRWKELNCKKNIEFIKEIQEKAYEMLQRDFKIHLRTSEAVIPLFCIFMDNVCQLLKMKWKEAIGTDISEIKINVMNLFYAYYSYNEDDNVEIFDFENILWSKKSIKNDEIASRE